MTLTAEIVRTPAATLDELAHEINVRLQKADDHRLSASLKLAEAKEACVAAGISFKSWVAKEIRGLGYPEATKLAKIGAAPDPAKALEDMRRRNAAGEKERRQRVAHVDNSPSIAPATLPSPVRPAPSHGRAAICARVREGIAKLSGLPPAHEVVGFLRGTDEAVIVDEHLSAAARWLAEFSDLWGDPS